MINDLIIDRFAMINIQWRFNITIAQGLSFSTWTFSTVKILSKRDDYLILHEISNHCIVFKLEILSISVCLSMHIMKHLQITWSFPNLELGKSYCVHILWIIVSFILTGCEDRRSMYGKSDNLRWWLSWCIHAGKRPVCTQIRMYLKIDRVYSAMYIYNPT